MKPAGMDDASWALIQTLQREEQQQASAVAARLDDDDDSDDDDDDEVVEVPPPPPSYNKRRHSISGSDDDDVAASTQERRDGKVADGRQKEEERRHRHDTKAGRATTRNVASAAAGGGGGAASVSPSPSHDGDATLARTIHRREELRLVRKKKKQEQQDRACSLTLCQTRAYDYVQGRAKEMHDYALPALRYRVRTNLPSFTQEDLTQCLEYIQHDAPIIIHLTEASLEKLVKDTHYRNLFETGTSGGSNNPTARREWEWNMFGTAYVPATAHERPKYGCLNLSGDIQGCASARRYGQCFLMLKCHVRNRCTFFSTDTGSGFSAPTTATSQSLATNEYYAHILQQFHDNDLASVLSVCKTTRLRGSPSSSATTTYKEVQIHGPILLSRDIQALSIPGRERNATAEWKALVQTFQKQTNCNLLWQEDLLNPENG